MSRGFVKEGDQEENPIIPPRAPLPPNTPNYVTVKGLAALEREMEVFKAEKQALQSDESDQDHRVDIRVLDIKMTQLEERINTAQLVAYDENDTPDSVRFGLEIGYRIGENPRVNTFRIVGVDEADVSEGKIAFTAPIAVALMGMQAGEQKEWTLGDEMRLLTLVEVKV